MATQPTRTTTQGVYGVLGHNIAYTLSPAIFRHVFDALGWPAVYGIFDLPPAKLRRFVQAAPDAGILGYNVTQPHKVRIIEHTSQLDGAARAVGAVNTVHCRGGKSVGFNTDIDGIEAALNKYRRALDGGEAVIVGAGGAARATVYGLTTRLRMSRVIVAARNQARGKKMVADMNAVCPRRCTIEFVLLKALGGDVRLTDADLIVNATPMGGPGQTPRLPFPARLRLSPHTIVFDLVYRPRRTPLLLRAQRAGCRTVGGWPMLIGQADAALNIWTGRSFPAKTRQALLRWNPR